jgi:hypothetical protein
VGFKIIQILLSAFIISLFLGITWNMVRGFIDGFIDGRENNEYNDKENK